MRRISHITKTSTIVGLLIFAVCSCTSFPSTKNPPPFYYTYLHDITGLKFGSAIMLSNGLLVTNKHVTDTLFMPSAKMAHNIELTIQTIHNAQDIDLSFLYVSCLPKAYFKKVRLENVKLKDKVKSYGPQRMLLGTSGVEISEVMQLNVQVEHNDSDLLKSTGFIHSTAIVGGYSGGPVVNSNGALIGINQGTVNVNDTEYTFAYSSQQIMQTALKVLGENWEKKC